MKKIKFTKPPLVEIAFVVEFEELVDFSSVHFGLYWERIKDKFPETFDKDPVFDENEESSFTPLIPLRRVFFVSENKSKAIQLQNKGFAYGWKRTNQSSDANFETLFKEFCKEWTAFKEWWSQLNFAQAEPQLLTELNYRLFYVNLIDKDSGWFDSKNYSDVFTFISEHLTENFKFPELFESQLFFKMSNELGLLGVNIKQLTQIQEEDEEDQVDIVSLRLEAISYGIREFDLETWYKSAHEYILECFLNLTQDTVKEKWGIYYE